MYLKVILLSSWFFVTCQATCTSLCLRDTPLGKLQGKCNDGMCSFTNIPYAENPINEKRLADPIPYRRVWTGTRDATQPSIGCIQFSARKNPNFESENCLFVNVHIPGADTTESYPIRTHFHGGGFMFGQAGDYDPSRIVKSGMIVVTIEYRLGPLGFLSTGDTCIPGNIGLKDQREALRWVQRYIRYFNGNPDQVLVSGFSAGGASTHLHMLRREKLFSAAMANNGDVFNPWVMQTKPYSRYAKFVAGLNCSSECAAAKKCIQGKSVQELFNAVEKMKVYRDNPFNVFGVVIESASVRDAFITEPPEDIIKSGKSAKVPFLIAYTEREGSYTAADWLTLGPDGKPIISLLVNNTLWLALAPHMLFFNDTIPKSQLDLVSTKLKQQFLGDSPISVKNYRQLEDLFSYVLYMKGIKRSICLYRKYGAGKLYVYEYKYPHTFGVGNSLSGRRDVFFGADHGADSIFTLPLLSLKPETLSSNELKIANNLCSLYKSLANGKPIYDGIELPLNTPVKSGMLTINEYCYSMRYCTDAHCDDCSMLEY